MHRISVSIYLAILFVSKRSVDSFNIATPNIHRLSQWANHKTIFQPKRLRSSTDLEMKESTEYGINVVNMPNIEVYSTLGCKYCRMAKFKLDELGVSYYSVDVTDVSVPTNAPNIERQVLRTEHARKNTVPQIYVGEDLLGGCDSLLKEVDNGTFFERLKNNNIIQSIVTADITSAIAALSTDSATQDLSSLLMAPRDGILNNVDVSSSSENIELTDLSSPEITDPLQLSSALQRQALLLTDQFSSADGSRVDYKKMKMSKEFKEYVRLSASLQGCSLDGISALSTQKRISFFVNLYNAMIIHANCVLVSTYCLFCSFNITLNTLRRLNLSLSPFATLSIY